MENQNINLIENENKSKKSKLLTWVATILLACAVGVCAVLNVVMPRYQKSSAYTIDYTEEYIEFSADELTNSTFPTLSSNLLTATADDFTGSYISYNGTNFSFQSLISGDTGFVSYVEPGEYTEEQLTILFYIEDSRFVLNDENHVYNFSYSIRWYSSWAIDNIESSSPSYPQQSWFDELISLLTGGIVGLSGGVGSGVSTLVSDIFISNNALSVMGGMIVVFAAISLAIGLCRWVMNFLTSLGAKK